jgi:hypothetical protein
MSQVACVFVHVAQDANNTPSMFNTVQTVFQEYDNSRMFRELRLRGHVLKDKELLVLPGERICSKATPSPPLSPFLSQICAPEFVSMLSTRLMYPVINETKHIAWLDKWIR